MMGIIITIVMPEMLISNGDAQKRSQGSHGFANQVSATNRAAQTVQHIIRLA